MKSRKGRITGAILNEELIRNIRLRGNKREVPTRELAVEFGMAVESIRRILRYETWGWVTDEGPGAEAAQWQEPVPHEYVAAPGEVEASLARLAAKLGGVLPAAPAKQMSTMEESLAAAARESDEVASRVAATFAAKDAAGDAQLAGLLNPGGIQSTITDEHGGKLEPKD